MYLNAYLLTHDEISSPDVFSIQLVINHLVISNKETKIDAEKIKSRELFLKLATRHTGNISDKVCENHVKSGFH